MKTIMQNENLHFLIAAGGTGGHLFPAMAVVNEIKKIHPKSRFTFTGREDKIEGRIIPKTEHSFLPIDVRGFTKKIDFNLLKLPFKFYFAYNKVKNYIKNNNVNAVICAGAYISYSPGLAASRSGTPLFLLEANVNPGKAIQLLSKKAGLIFTSFEESKNYFDNDIHSKIIYTGNPVRDELLEKIDKKEALSKFNFVQTKKTILIFGGSLGAKSINNATLDLINHFGNQFQFIWQTGSNYEINKNLPDNVRQFQFIDDMALAYSAADIVISRSGATTVAELEVLSKPSILVPLPSASNNEQYYNAKSLEDNNAAIVISDEQLKDKLIKIVNDLIRDDDRLNKMANYAGELAKPTAAKSAAENILNYLNK
jgi:UDP-N-acetylglucosamine--N-acetylmuramyl-(pentapeptide) pyrophosphoryl-undecaprenol N-acetylglucosamine transferase